MIQNLQQEFNTIIYRFENPMDQTVRLRRLLDLGFEIAKNCPYLDEDWV